MRLCINRFLGVARFPMIKFKVYPCNPHHTTSSAFQTPSLPQAATGNVWSLTPRVHDLRSWQRMTCSMLIRDQRLTNQLAANFNQNESV